MSVHMFMVIHLIDDERFQPAAERLTDRKTMSVPVMLQVWTRDMCIKDPSILFSVSLSVLFDLLAAVRRMSLLNKTLNTTLVI